MTHIIVHRSHPVQYYGFRLFVFLLMAALLWGAFELGYLQSEEDIIKEKGGRKSLLVQQRILQKNNKELSKNVLHLERKYLLEKEASHLIQASISKEQRKIVDLEKQLVFYKSLLNSSKRRATLYLQQLEIIPLDREGKASNEQGQFYQFNFIVAQKSRKSSYSKGLVKIFISGKQNSKTIRLPLNSLLTKPREEKEKSDKAFKFSFKYFQEFKGIIKLPKGMIAQSIDIVIDSKKKKSIVELNDLKWSTTKGVKYVGQ
jgi:hypothetical protein